MLNSLRGCCAQVHSEHDSKFYQLMRQVEKECGELDWTNAGGAAVGGSAVAVIDDDDDDMGNGSRGSAGRRLGGGTSTSRLLLPQEGMAPRNLHSITHANPDTVIDPTRVDDEQEEKPSVISVFPPHEDKHDANAAVTAAPVGDVAMGTSSDDNAAAEEAVLPTVSESRIPENDVEMEEARVIEELSGHQPST